MQNTPEKTTVILMSNEKWTTNGTPDVYRNTDEVHSMISSVWPDEDQDRLFDEFMADSNEAEMYVDKLQFNCAGDIYFTNDDDFNAALVK